MQIASLYFEFKDPEKANLYLNDYLSEFSLDPNAWKLKGNLTEEVKNDPKSHIKAIEHYAKAYEMGNRLDIQILLKSTPSDQRSKIKQKFISFFISFNLDLSM